MRATCHSGASPSGLALLGRNPAAAGPGAVAEQSTPAGRAGTISPAPVRVAIFNVKYSPNLGDGLIAQCLEFALAGAEPAIRPHALDLAGRSGFYAANGKRRQFILRLAGLLPDALRRRLMPLALNLLVRLRLQAKWRAGLEGCDAAVIGGGALLADADRNFPTKLAGALDLCAGLHVPVVFASVGVTPGWSDAGRRDFLAAAGRATIIGASVRDRASIDSWKREFGDALPLPLPQLALDPGLLCSLAHPVQVARRKTEGDRSERRIGIGLTHPLVLQLHGKHAASRDRYDTWLRGWIEDAAAVGRIVLFTNGSPEDEDFADEVAGWFGPRDAIERAPRFIEPGQLARFIAGLDLVASHRLHACIAAYSYRVPAIGFSWDRKVDSFFDLTARSAYLQQPCLDEGPSPSEIIRRALSDPPDASRHRALLDECRAGVAILARQLAGLAAGRAHD